MRSRTFVKRNAVFGARFKGLSPHFLYRKGNLIRIQTGLDTYLICIQTHTPLSRYPPLMIILNPRDALKVRGKMIVFNLWPLKKKNKNRPKPTLTPRPALNRGPGELCAK